MKKVILSIICAAACVLAASAQEGLEKATNTYNQAAEELGMGENADALASFESALKQAKELGEAGEEIAAQCQEIIPKLYLQLGKEAIKAKKYDDALAKLDAAVAKATEFGNNEDIAETVAGLVPGINLKKAQDLIKEKNFDGAAELLKDMTAKNPSDGTAFLLLGQCLSTTGDIAGAEAALVSAIENGQEKQASKLLSTMFLKECQKFLKEKKFKEAIAAADKSNGYQENANALKLAGNAAMQLKDNDSAIKYLSKYVEISPNANDYSQICYNIATIYQGMKNNAKAIEYYKMVSPADPKVGAYAVQQLQALGAN